MYIERLTSVERGYRRSGMRRGVRDQCGAFEFADPILEFSEAAWAKMLKLQEEHPDGCKILCIRHHLDANRVIDVVLQ